MSTHNICFHGEIRKISCGYPLLSVAMAYARVLSAVGSAADGRSLAHKFESQLSCVNFAEIDHGIISAVMLPLLLIQEGQLSVIGEIDHDIISTVIIPLLLIQEGQLSVSGEIDHEFISTVIIPFH